MSKRLTNKNTRCSFCGRDAGEVSLIAGPDVYICEICVESSVEILRSNLSAVKAKPKKQWMLPQDSYMILWVNM
jgi:ATP-dependent Clp protease ATP-binding subunit ClpX